MRQRLGLAAALLTVPRLLVLDEPANGLDPAGKRHVHDTLTRVAADGTAVVLTSHRMDDLEELCSDITVLAIGQVVFSGPLDKLADRNGELDYQLVTSDIEAARQVAADTDGIQVIDNARGRPDREVLVVRALVSDLDELVPRLVHAGIAVRELTPVISPLESAFLSLTQQHAQESSQ
jgi:ABC-2 type transport system ATP-binding protein